MALSMNLQTIPQKRANFELEQDLVPVIQKIEEEKDKRLSFRQITPVMKNEFLDEVKEKPWIITSKVVLIAFAVLALHPLIVGAIACIDTYRVENWQDVFSSNLTTVNDAAQLFSNLGHGVGYTVEGLELIILTTLLLFLGSYKKAVCRIIDGIYKNHIQNKALPLEERAFLYKMKRQELAYYGYAHTIRKKLLEETHDSSESKIESTQNV